MSWRDTHNTFNVDVSGKFPEWSTKYHYKRLSPEPIEVINNWELNFNIGNVLKYIARYQYKSDPIGDLEKAQQYLDYEIQRQKRIRGL